MGIYANALRKEALDPEGYQAYVEERAKSCQETERKQMNKK